MTYLPLANVLHHKLRSVLSASGIAIAVCMLITLAGLARGSLNEVIERWDAVNADLIVAPSSTNLTMASGGAISTEVISRIEASTVNGYATASRVTPVYLARLQIGEQEHNVFGLAAGDFNVFSGKSRILRGREPDEDGRFARWLSQRFAEAAETGELLDIPGEELGLHGGLEVIVDTKLARNLNKDLGDEVVMAGHTWRIVGIFEAGAVSRAMAPISTLQYLLNGRLDRMTLLFVKLQDNVPHGVAAQSLRESTRQLVLPRGEYRAMLLQNFGIMLPYVDTVNAIALIIALLFIMVTLYTMVLQRTREIAILKSMGATKALVLRLVLAESLILTGFGAVIGVGLSFLAGYGIERLRPLLTVSITGEWVVIAVAASLFGAIIAGLYPAWHAASVDVAEVLTYE